MFKEAWTRIRSIWDPVLIHRMTCLGGTRLVTVILKRPWGAKTIAKFEVLKEIDPYTTYPGYAEIGFRSFHVKERKVMEEPPFSSDS